MAWTIEKRDWDDPAGVALRTAQRAELDLRYGGPDHEPGTPPSAADIDVFLVAVDDAGEPICQLPTSLIPPARKIAGRADRSGRSGATTTADLLGDFTRPF